MADPLPEDLFDGLSDAGFDALSQPDGDGDDDDMFDAMSQVSVQQEDEFDGLSEVALSEYDGLSIGCPSVSSEFDALSQPDDVESSDHSANSISRRGSGRRVAPDAGVHRSNRHFLKQMQAATSGTVDLISSGDEGESPSAGPATGSAPGVADPTGLPSSVGTPDAAEVSGFLDVATWSSYMQLAWRFAPAGVKTILRVIMRPVPPAATEEAESYNSTWQTLVDEYVSKPDAPRYGSWKIEVAKVPGGCNQNMFKMGFLETAELGYTMPRLFWTCLLQKLTQTQQHSYGLVGVTCL